MHELLGRFKKGSEPRDLHIRSCMRDARTIKRIKREHATMQQQAAPHAYTATAAAANVNRKKLFLNPADKRRRKVHTTVRAQMKSMTHH